ncbi:MAG: exosortase/archaeosortase family protein [Chlamydiales bacterium]|jgi:exosortase/archaeosortase family protein
MGKNKQNRPVPSNRQPSVVKQILTRFAIFFGTLGAFYGVTAMSWFRDSLFPVYLRLNARISAWILNVLGENAGSREFLVFTSKFQLEIRKGCDAIEPSALLVAAVLITPIATSRQKLTALAIGVPSLLIVNLVRIISLYYTGVHYPEAFEMVHVDIWQPGFVALTLIVWALWAASVLSKANKPKPAVAEDA